MTDGDTFEALVTDLLECLIGWPTYSAWERRLHLLAATPAGVLNEAALLDAALTTAILAMAGIPCGEPHDSDLRYAFGPDGSFAADLRAALRGSGHE